MFIDLGAVGGVLRDRLAQGVQRLRQIIRAPLDVDHRAAASAAASPPGRSATLIASCRAEPFAYASTSLDRNRPRPPSGGDRTGDPHNQATTRTPANPEPRPRLPRCEVWRRRSSRRGRRGSAAGQQAPAGEAGGDVVTLWVVGGVVGAAVTLGLTGTSRWVWRRRSRSGSAGCAGRAGDGATASRGQAADDHDGRQRGESFRRTPHDDPSASLTAQPLERPSLATEHNCSTGYRFPHPCPDGLVAAPEPCDYGEQDSQHSGQQE